LAHMDKKTNHQRMMSVWLGLDLKMKVSKAAPANMMRT
jgi:hypothetical protein